MQYEREYSDERARKIIKERRKRGRRFFVGYTIVMSSLLGLILFLLLLMKMDTGRLREQLEDVDSRVEAVRQEMERVQQGEEIKDDEPAPVAPEIDTDAPFGPESYAAECGLEQVDKPVERTTAEILRRLKELGKENALIDRIYKSRLSYPDKMLEALANNPEMADFVEGYTGYVSEAAGGLNEDELARRFPLFLQWDPRWGYVNYGNGSCIGLAGCGPTCLSMALFYLTGDETLTPDKVAAYSMKNGHYVSGSGTAWSLFTDLPARYGVSVGEPAISKRKLQSELDLGKIVICSMKPGDFTAAGHFIVIYGYDSEGFLINDPNCVARSVRRWTFEEISGQIKHTWVFGKEKSDTFGLANEKSSG